MSDSTDRRAPPTTAACTTLWVFSRSPLNSTTSLLPCTQRSRRQCHPPRLPAHTTLSMIARPMPLAIIERVVCAGKRGGWHCLRERGVQGSRLVVLFNGLRENTQRVVHAAVVGGARRSVESDI